MFPLVKCFQAPLVLIKRDSYSGIVKKCKIPAKNKYFSQSNYDLAYEERTSDLYAKVDICGIAKWIRGNLIGILLR